MKRSQVLICFHHELQLHMGIYQPLQGSHYFWNVSGFIVLALCQGSISSQQLNLGMRTKFGLRARLKPDGVWPSGFNAGLLTSKFICHPECVGVHRHRQCSLVCCLWQIPLQQFSCYCTSTIVAKRRILRLAPLKFFSCLLAIRDTRNCPPCALAIPLRGEEADHANDQRLEGSVRRLLAGWRDLLWPQTFLPLPAGSRIGAELHKQR